MTARLLAGIVGLFYIVSGLWAVADPTGFAGSVATFSPFNRHLLHDTGAFSTGLGLALTQALVTRSGGKISVESEPGRGTTFRLTLPSRRAA